VSPSATLLDHPLPVPRLGARGLLPALLALILAGCGGMSAAERSQALYHEGQAALLRGKTEEALRHLRSSLEIAQRSRHREAAAAGHHAIAMIHIGQERWREALGHMEAALAADREILKEAKEKGRDEKTLHALEAKVAADLNDLARLHRRLGEPRAALDRLQEMLAIDLRLGRERGAAITHNNIARILLALDEFAEAERHYKASLALFEKLGDTERAREVRRGLALLEAVRRRSRR